MIDSTAIVAIGAYQRYVSPYKGYCCAYRALTGKRSCSTYALAIVERVGAGALTRALPRQFARCKEAYDILTSRTAVATGKTSEEKKPISTCQACVGSIGSADCGL